jgi:hypothetical protein
MWISLLSIRTLHADKILIVVRDGVRRFKASMRARAILSSTAQASQA